MTLLSIPFPCSYWVIPGKLLAGFYPGSKDPKEATAKLTAIINVGIRHVINLMEPEERDLTGHRFVPYDDMMESIAAILKVSVTVVGCYLLRHGLANGKNVLDMIRDLRKDSEDSGRKSPETREQREMVVGWQKRM